MRKLLSRSALALAFLAVLAGNALTLSYTVIVNYPSSAYLGQEITISFQLLSNYINSTDFPIISTGTEVIHNGSETTYTGGIPYGGYLLFQANISATTPELIVTFIGEYHAPNTTNPGIILYGGNFNPPLTDGDQNNYISVLIAFDGRLWYHINGGWYEVLSSLPYYGSFIDGWLNVSTPVNYTAILEEYNGLTLVKDILINNKLFIIDYLTPIPWNFSYIGIRTDGIDDFLTPLRFCVTSPLSEPFPLSYQPYVIYVNGKEYDSGYTNELGQGSISLKVSSLHEVINITFPNAHEYKVIMISSSQGNVKVNYPIFPLSLLGVSIILTAISVKLSLTRK